MCYHCSGFKLNPYGNKSLQRIYTLHDRIMLLQLKVINYKQVPAENGVEVVFDEQGGSIGRGEDNALVLPDPEKFISRSHAQIEYVNGYYSLTNLGLSGTYVDDNNLSTNGQKIDLRDGIRVYIGEYEIAVSMVARSPDAASGLDGVFGDPGNEFKDFDSSGLIPSKPIVADDNYSFPSDLFGDAPDNQPQIERSEAIDHNSPLNENFVSPQVEINKAQHAEIPDNFSIDDFFNDDPLQPEEVQHEISPIDDLPNFEDELQSDPFSLTEKPSPKVQPPVTQIPQIPQRPPAPVDSRPVEVRRDPSPRKPPVSSFSDQDTQALLKVFFEAAGITDERVYQGRSPKKIMGLMGVMFRELVQGLMTVLRGRAEWKSQIRVSVTVIRPVENNPLKFSASTNDALNVLFSSNPSGYLKPVEAIQDGFDDIMKHQLAMNAGIQAALRELVKRFDPRQFENQFKDGLVFKKKAKCWDAFVESYPQTVRLALEDFFGDEFRRAYDEQIQKAVRR